MKSTFFNIFTFSLAMALSMLLPTTINAQSDGFFRGGETGNYENRDISAGGGMSLGGATNENPTPVGSGLLILAAAGAGYAVVRRKRNYGNYKSHNTYRHGATLIIALALILGMTQCKKKEVAQINTADNGVHITLVVDNGGEKTDFLNGTFTWSADSTEYINVGGNHSGYIGQLSGTGNGSTSMTFTGTITPDPELDTQLYFFYLGSGNHAGSTKVDFSSQTGLRDYVTNCHIAISGPVEYTGTETSFTATLNMKMAIAYFDLRGFGNNTVFLHGNDVFSAANVNYTNGTITGVTQGNIMLGKGGQQYVALIPSTDNNKKTLIFESPNESAYSIEFLRGIQAGKYYSDSGNALTVNVPASVSNIPVFTVSDSGKKVIFSPGNLQYQASTNTWRFAENQWDYVGGTYNNVEYGNVKVNNVKCDNAQISQNYTGWIDLFGWGTSGYNHGATHYEPWSISTTNSDYQAYGVASKNLHDNSKKAEWGFNLNYNGGDISKMWRTLTKDEWTWLIGAEKEKSVNNKHRGGRRFLRANVEVKSGKWYKGLIIFPDNTENENGYNNYNGDYETVYNESWNTMLTGGAAFLPAAGYREKGTEFKLGYKVNNTEYYRRDHGCYWSATGNSSGTSAECMYFFYYEGSTATTNNVFVSKLGPENTNTKNRSLGYSVRLVRDVN